jgi:hypothetical protein
VNPTELHLFSEKEQTLLVATEPKRLAEMNEDELDALLTLVRRARTKYTKLHRRQSGTSIDAAGKRYAATSSNTRTLRKAEIFEGALARVSKSLSAAAAATAKELKAERIAAARGEVAPAAATKAPAKKPTTKQAAATRKPSAKATAKASTKTPAPKVSAKRAASTTASGSRRQAKRDR